MPGISLHAVDIARGRPAEGMAVQLYALGPERHLIAEGFLAAKGALDHPSVHDTLPQGAYEAVFQVGAFYRETGFAVPQPSFLDDVVFRFTLSDPSQHYHLPLKFSPYGFSVWRGS
jgi:5-hydroxyisourate hydrolase